MDLKRQPILVDSVPTIAKRLRKVACPTVAVVLAISIAAPANAAGSQAGGNFYTAAQATMVAQQVANAQVSVGETTTPVSTGGPASITDSADQMVVSFRGVEKDLSIDLPGQAKLRDAISVTGGRRVMQTSRQDLTVVAQTDNQGAAQMFTVLHGKSASETFFYTLRLGAGSKIEMLQSGGAVVISADLKHAVNIEAPWAVDAQGRHVPTRYEVHGDTLIQRVDHLSGNFSYPIVADPRFYSRWFGGELVFSRNETVAIAVGGAGAAATLLGGGCAAVPIPAIRLACVPFAAFLGVNAAYFAAMHAANRCGKIFVYWSGHSHLVAGGQRLGDRGCF